MSERSHRRSQRDVVTANGLNPRHGYCVPTAWARAVATDPADVEEVARIFPHVLRKLQRTGCMRRGSWRGGRGGEPSQAKAAAAVGFTGFEVREADHDESKAQIVDVNRYGWGFADHQQYRHRDGYPTTAQWLRRNPDVRRAVLRGTGHAGFMVRDENGKAHVYDMGARKRIDHVIVLDSAEAPADLAAHANPAPAQPARRRTTTTKRRRTMTHTRSTLRERTIAELRDLAKGMGVEQIDARRHADGKTPNKEHWIDAILEKQGEGRVYRFAVVTNAKSGNPNRIKVSAEGNVPESDQKRIGCPAVVEEWTEIHGAPSQAEAGKLFEAGEGKTVRREDVLSKEAAA